MEYSKELFKIRMGKRGNFVEVIRLFGHAPRKEVANAGLDLEEGPASLSDHWYRDG